MITTDLLLEIHKQVKGGSDLSKVKVYVDTGYGPAELKAVVGHDGKLILCADSYPAMAEPIYPERVS